MKIGVIPDTNRVAMSCRQELCVEYVLPHFFDASNLQLCRIMTEAYTHEIQDDRQKVKAFLIEIQMAQRDLIHSVQINEEFERLRWENEENQQIIQLLGNEHQGINYIEYGRTSGITGTVSRERWFEIICTIYAFTVGTLHSRTIHYHINRNTGYSLHQ